MRFSSFGSAGLTPLEKLELLLTALGVLLALTKPFFAATRFARLERQFVRMAERPWLSVAVVAGLPVLLRLLLVPSYGPPTPFVHDEYAYLLQSDTFAQGRLANPTPLLPDAFSSIYILVTPTYSSEYQPGQAAFLFIGQVLTGNPWAGVILSMATFCLALYWALKGWLSPAWALAGVLLFEAGDGVLSYWMNSYWGGCVPALGGALVMGAVPRLRDGPRSAHGFVLGLGAVVLLYSRPLEGALLLLVMGCALVYAGFKNRSGFKNGLTSGSLFRYGVTPAVLVLMAGAAFLGYYNYRVTGSARTLPYSLYRARYGTPQGFLWQRPLPALGPMPIDIRAEYDDQLQQHARQRSFKELARLTFGKLRRFWTFYIGVPLTLPLVFVPRIRRLKYMTMTGAALAIVLLDNLTFFAYFPHYSAPIAAAIFLVIAQCFRAMRQSDARGLALSRLLGLVSVIGFLLPICGRLAEPFLPDRAAALWTAEFQTPRSRERLVPQVAERPGNHLVFVRYDSARHQNENAWVYNRADIQQSRIIWAREFDDPRANQKVLEQYGSGRTIWLAEPDAEPPRLSIREPNSDWPHSPR